MRGLSAGFAGNQSSATIAQFPNVATYLDDQSLTFPARNLDVYFVDMERVEVLEGPQGTLFGGGAEAGAVRYITNKPKLNVTEGNAEGSYGTTAHGSNNGSANATINLPLIQDTLAVRASSTATIAAATSTTFPAPSPARTAIWAISTPASSRPAGFAPMACRPRRRTARCRAARSPTNNGLRPAPPTRSTTTAYVPPPCIRSMTTGTCWSRRATRTWKRTASSRNSRSDRTARSSAPGKSPHSPRVRQG